MMQREQKHPNGTFLRCAGCAREPMHVQINGTHSSEQVRTAGGVRHMLECCRCGRRTARHTSLALAVTEWGSNYAQVHLPLRAVSRKAAA